MDGIVAFLLQSGILWVLLILGVIVVGIWVLVFNWQNEIKDSQNEIPPGFNHLESELKNILQAIQAYSPDDPQPYGPLAAEIIREVDTVANRLVLLNKKHADIQYQLNKLRPGSWQLFIGAPFYFFIWFGLYREMKEIQREILELQKTVDHARSKIKELDDQAWLLSMRVRAVVAQQKSIRSMIDYLSGQKLYGETFEAIIENEDLTIEVLERIPEHFLLADEHIISKNASKAEVWEVHKILSETEPVLVEMQEKLNLWTAKYESLVEKAEKYRQQLARVEQLLEAAPDEMIVDAQKKQLVVLGDTLKVLTDTLTRLEIESIDPVEQELDQVKLLSSEIASQLRRGYRELSDLKMKLEQLLELRAGTSDLFERLLRNPVYPVLWDNSQNQFMELNKRVNELGGPEKSRTLQDIDEDLDAAQEVAMRLKAVFQHLQKVEGWHEELVELLSSDEILQGSQRLAEYHHLASAIAIYSPENFTADGSATGYLEAVQSLELAHNTFVQREPAKRLAESEIHFWLQKVQHLVNDHKKILTRSEKLRARLQFIKDTEDKAEDLYETVHKALNQIKWIANSNLLLKRISEKEINRISLQIGQCGDQLSARQSGLIEKKYQTVLSLKESLEDAGYRWLEQLNHDVEQRSTLLQVKIEVLGKIARLDDPTIDKVQRLLSKEDAKQRTRSSTSVFHMPLEEIIAALKARSVTWQEFIAAQKELEEIVETPLLDAYNHAETQRRQAIDSLTKATSIIPEQRQWPPCTASVEEERLELSRLENARSALINKDTRAIWAVRQYGELAASYQTLAGKIERTSDWARNEQSRIVDLEKEIERLSRYWQKQEQIYSAEPEIVEQIRYLRAQANLSLERQKQNWVLSTPGAPVSERYESILRSLIEVVRTLKSFTVKIQDDSESSNRHYRNNPQPDGEAQDEKI